MIDPVVRTEVAGPVAIISLNDPAKRNAMTVAMFDALDRAIALMALEESVHVVLLRGEGAAFCAGFDLAAALADQTLLPQFIVRLSALNRSLRRLPQIVVAAVHGAAIAGGCAILSACDFVFVSADAILGYPVHRLGISPAVTIPTLQQAIGPGPARTLLMSGELITGADAKRIGLATHLSESAASVQQDALAHCHSLTTKGIHALRMTKAWLNELDGSLDDASFDQSALGSTELCNQPEARILLARWQQARP
jgi:methylglutaconyl-CoA hydratase